MSRLVCLMWLLIFCFLSRCTTRSINIDLPTGVGRPVLLSLMTNQDSVDVFVSQTAPARGSAPASIYILGAQVSVYADEQVIANQGRYLGGGIYRLRRNKALQAGVAYRLQASTPDGITVSSVADTLPTPVPITSFVARGNSFTLTFTDPSGANYYLVDVALYYRQERVFRLPTYPIAFPDDSFNGQVRSVTGSLPDQATVYSLSDIVQVVKADSAQVRLLTLSPRTYQYYASLNAYDLSAGSPEIEPTAPLSGILDGEGYFGVGNSINFYTYHFK